MSKRCLMGGQPPKRLIGRGWLKLRAARGMLWH